jgi:hypothetical protein
MSPRAFGFGMALFPVRIKNLTIPVAYVILIAAASLSPRSSAVALRLVLVVFPILLPVRVYSENPAVRGGHSKGRRNRRIWRLCMAPPPSRTDQHILPRAKTPVNQPSLY